MLLVGKYVKLQQKELNEMLSAGSIESGINLSILQMRILVNRTIIGPGIP